MKIAVPTRGSNVDDHFGHCEMLTLFTLKEGKGIDKTEILPSPKGCGCKSNIAGILQQSGVTLLLAGNMGNGALQVLNRHGIQVIRGCSGDVQAVVLNYLDGSVADSGEGCQEHQSHAEGHNCKH